MNKLKNNYFFVKKENSYKKHVIFKCSPKKKVYSDVYVTFYTYICWSPRSENPNRCGAGVRQMI